VPGEETILTIQRNRALKETTLSAAFKRKLEYWAQGYLLRKNGAKRSRSSASSAHIRFTLCCESSAGEFAIIGQ
jgi:hypothetical protein